MDTEFILYCDESGNSGPNYLDAGQPFYVLAGWWIPVDALVDVTIKLEEIRAMRADKNYVPSSPLDVWEVKATSLVKRAGGQRILTDLFKFLGQRGCIPTYLIAEKRFVVAAKIVETFLDPAYNDAFSMGFTGDFKTKLQIANDIYDEVDDSVANAFAIAYRSPTAESLSQSLSEVVREIKSTINPELAEAFKGCDAKIDEISRDEAAGAAMWNGAAGTLNLPCLVSFLMLVEYNAKSANIRLQKLIHDQQLQYEHGYNEIFNALSSGKDRAIKLPDVAIPLGKINHIPEFEMADSKLNPLMQAPDLLAGTINHLFKKVASNQELSDCEKELGQYVLPPLLFDEIPKLTWPILSNKLHVETFKSIFECYDMEVVKKSEVNNTGPAKPAPMFPKVGGLGDGTPKKPFTFPAFALVNKSDGKSASLPLKDDSENRCFIPLFLRRDAATAFVKQHLNHDFEVIEFDAPTVDDFQNLLDMACEYADFVVVDPADEVKEISVLFQFKSQFAEVIDRVKRVAKSGVSNLIYQTHRINEANCFSMLVSSGKYVAGVEGCTEVYEGITREAAIEKLTATMASQ